MNSRTPFCTCASCLGTQIEDQPCDQLRLNNGSIKPGVYRHPLVNIAEWRKGCSCAPTDSPAQCEQCTEGLILAVENWFTQRNTHRGAVADNILANLDDRAAEANSPGIAGDAATLIRELDAELYAAQDQIAGLQELMACGDKALARAQEALAAAERRDAQRVELLRLIKACGISGNALNSSAVEQLLDATLHQTATAGKVQ